MTVTYSDVNTSNYIYQPSYVRWRHYYRSPRSSLRVNQEISMMYYDMNNINNRNIDTRQRQDMYSDVILYGGEIDGVEFDFTDEEPATLSTEQLTIVGLEEIGERIESLRSRVYTLENK